MIINCRQLHFLCLRTAYGAELQMFCFVFFLPFLFQFCIDPPSYAYHHHHHTDRVKSSAEKEGGGGFRVVRYGHSSFRRYIVNGSLMATVAMATLLEQLLPTTSQKIRDVIFEDKTSLKANTGFLH